MEFCRFLRSAKFVGRSLGLSVGDSLIRAKINACLFSVNPTRFYQIIFR